LDNSDPITLGRLSYLYFVFFNKNQFINYAWGWGGFAILVLPVTPLYLFPPIPFSVL